MELIERMRLYHCKSTDEKKTNDIDEGSILYETDTSKKYRFDGVEWAEYFDSVGIDGVSILPTNGSDGLVVIEPNHISVLNSSNQVLGISEIFTGESEDITNYAIAFINVYSDVASAENGLCIEHSSDGVTWYQSECYTIFASTYKTFSHQCSSKYIRVKYTNGAIAQNSFDLEVKLCTKDALDSSHRISDTISSEDDATLNKSVITAERPDGNFINVGASDNGNLKITDAENKLAIAKGEVIGSSYVNKWGNAKDFDTADGEVNIWDGTEDGQPWEQMEYIFPTTATIDSVSSTSSSDVGISVDLNGLASDGTLLNQTVTLNGQNRVAITPMLRFSRGYNSNGTKFDGHIIIYENGTISGGVPTDSTTIKGVIHPDEQQTEMAVYTIPAGKTGYLTSGYCSTAGANKSSNYIIKLKTRQENGVFRTQQKVSISDNGTSFISFDYPVPQKLEALTDIVITAQMTVPGGTGASISAGFGIILVDN